MNEELRKAAERVLWQDRPHEDYWMQEDHDEYLLSSWIIAELARRDAEQAERERPIDEEWLKTLGDVIRDDDYALAVQTEFMTIVHAKKATKYATACRFADALGCPCALEAKTRGNISDLQNALKGGAT